MKLKKLISVITALSIAFLFMIGVSVTASAAPAFVSINNAFSTGVTLSSYITTLNPNDGGVVEINISADENLSLPSLIKYSDIECLKNYYNNGINITLKINIKDPSTGIIYTLSFKGSDVNANSAALQAAGDINLALSFEPASGKLTLYVKTYSGGSGDIGLPIKYKITSSYWSSLLAQAGVYPNPTISYFSIKSDTKIGEINAGVDGDFTINDACRTGLYFQETGANTPYISKKEATALIKKVLMERIGLTEKQINGTDTEFTNLVDYYNKAIKALSKEMTDNYVNKNDIDDMISDYLDDHKDALVAAVINDQKLEDKIKDQISDVLGDEVTLSQQQALVDYIKNSVTAEVTKQVGTYDTPSELIKNVVKNAVNEAVANKVDQLKTDILNAITGGKTIQEFVNSLKGEQGEQGIQGPQGEQGIQGIPGQNFEEWLVNRYGSEENFIQYIVSRVSAGVKDGKSAYELAVDNGYNGTLTEWLESLKGEDGKSAYEIAVAYGYTGSELEWLQTLGSNNDDDILETEDEEDEENVEEEMEDDEDSIYNDEVNGAYEDLETEDNEGPDPDTEPVIPDNDDNPEPDIEIEEDNNSGNNSGNNNHYYNPATGAALGIIIPGAAVGSILLIRKGKRKRGRR